MLLTRRRFLDLGIEISIGLAFVGAVILYAYIGPFQWMPGLRWWFFAAMTGVVFWYAVVEFRRHWRRRPFWLHVSWLAALHVAAWSIVLATVPVWPTLWFLPAFVIEPALLVLILHKLGYSVSG